MRKYIDKYGAVWVKTSPLIVKRLDDSCIGGWFNGKGLQELV